MASSVLSPTWPVFLQLTSISLTEGSALLPLLLPYPHSLSSPTSLLASLAKLTNDHLLFKQYLFWTAIELSVTFDIVNPIFLNF
jgi:hypothetical protein